MKPVFERGARALVTGGTSGIGWAIACALREAGCRVAVTGVDSEAVREAQSASGGKGIEPRVLDVSDQEAIESLAAGLDRLDVLIHSAGMILRGGAEFEMEGFERVIDVNLNGAMRVSRACRPLLAARHGSIVHIASMLSFFGSAQAPAYSASKGGLVQLTKSLALAWAGEGIRVNAIAPGWISTEFTRPVREDEKRNRAILDRTPLGRWGKPEEIAGAAVFLASPQAAFITGVVLPVDGGYTSA
jgi:NAD(P)-dependent dehydrogenase (short-subunit alcohol dehydrogenase family)